MTGTAQKEGLPGLDAARAGEIDVGGMLAAISELPRQLTAGYEVARRMFASAAATAGGLSPSGFVACGMGGSAIGADLALAAAPGLAVPAAVVRGYDLPCWAGVGTLVVAVSYSGDTEETLACAEAAAARGCTLVCVASGGTLAALAESRGATLVRVPGGGQPRAALGHLTAPVLAVLDATGLARLGGGDVAETAGLLRAGVAELGLDGDEATNPAKALARRLHRRQAVVYGAGLTVPVARRWKGQLNENAKAPAFWNEIPELDHNELMGWTSLPAISASTVGVFLDGAADPRLARRAALTAEELRSCGLAVEMVEARGRSRLARLFSLVQLGDYVSFYLALLYGVDPTPVGAIQSLKSRLAASGRD